MEQGDEFNADEIIQALQSVHADLGAPENEGLRERKKRRLRQRLSDVATAMFLAEGFENVSVARIAEACEVSEQTVFNYFPTKESMFYDRSEAATAALADAIRTRGPDSLAEVIASVLVDGHVPGQWGGLEETQILAMFRRFGEVAESSPTLRAAPYLQLPDFVATIGEALAERIGADADDPEAQVIAVLIAGVFRIRATAGFGHVKRLKTIKGVNDAVRADIERAVAVAAPSLDAFERRR
jgi:AcrR family transcriptional regulator